MKILKVQNRIMTVVLWFPLKGKKPLQHRQSLLLPRALRDSRLWQLCQHLLKVIRYHSIYYLVITSSVLMTPNVTRIYFELSRAEGEKKEKSLANCLHVNAVSPRCTRGAGRVVPHPSQKNCSHSQKSSGYSLFG